MNIAKEEAKKAYSLDEVPIGAVLVDNNDNSIICSSHNEVNIQNNSIKQIIDSLARNDSASKSLHSVTLCLSSALITSAGFWKVFSGSELQATSMAINTIDRTINFFITISLIKSRKA